MPPKDDDGRRPPGARLGRAHRLSPHHRARTPEEVTRSLVALHSSDPASVYLAVAARTGGVGAAVADVERALYDDRSLVTVMGMRRTLWVVPADLVATVAAACGRAVAAEERRKLVAAVEASGLAEHGPGFVDSLAERTIEAVAAAGAARTSELTQAVPDLRRKVRIGGDSKWATEVGLSSRIVLLLLCEGRIVRARPVGSWISTAHRYAVAPPRDDDIPVPDAQAALASLWLDAFGPTSEDVTEDLRWWAGWTVAATKRALAAAGWDRPPAPRDPPPWAAFLPSLDPTAMGWKHRAWYAGGLAPQVFDRTGNAGATVWFDGRIVGAWGQRPHGEIAFRLLADIGADAVQLVEAEAARLQAWSDASGTVVRARFPSALQRELSQ